MLEPQPFLSYDPNRLFDTVATWFGVRDDKMLSRVLHLSPPVIRGMRARRLPVQPSILAAIAESSGKSLDELRVLLGDRRQRARMSCRIRVYARQEDQQGDHQRPAAMTPASKNKAA